MSSGTIYVDGVATTAYYCSEPEVPNQEEIQSLAYGQNHYDIFEAAEDGDYDKFMQYAPKATINDLEWCVEKASDLRIIRYIIEVRKIKGFIHEAYRQAIRNRREDIMDYFETRDKNQCISRIQAWIDQFLGCEEDSPGYTQIDETDPQYISPIVEPEKDPRAYDQTTYKCIDWDICTDIQDLNYQKEYLLMKQRLNKLINS